MNNIIPKRHDGFSLIEIMVGMVIGLIAVVVIMQVFSTFEGQKRSTTGNADTQTNGSLSLYFIEREALMAGFGLVAINTTNVPLRCTTAGVAIAPVTIVDGAAGASDQIILRYGSSASAGLPSPIVSVAGSTLGLFNNLGCTVGDTVLITNGTNCAMDALVTGPTDILPIPVPTGDNTRVELSVLPAVAVPGALLTCLGTWNQVEFRVNDNKLERNSPPLGAAVAIGTPIQSDIVNIQAQYGVSTEAKSNVITAWVDATGIWGAGMTADNRTRIKAIRVAVVARNGFVEKDTNPTVACTTTRLVVNQGPCVWNDAAPWISPAPMLDLSTSIASWGQYRYRVFDTVVPIRSLIWSRNTM